MIISGVAHRVFATTGTLTTDITPFAAVLCLPRESIATLYCFSMRTKGRHGLLYQGHEQRHGAGGGAHEKAGLQLSCKVSLHAFLQGQNSKWGEFHIDSSDLCTQKKLSPSPPLSKRCYPC